MSRITRRLSSIVAIACIAIACVPVAASAAPADLNAPKTNNSPVSEPAPTVAREVRTVIRDELNPALPIVLSSSALLVAFAGLGYALNGSGRLHLRRQVSH